MSTAQMNLLISTNRIGTEPPCQSGTWKKLAQVIAKLLPLQLLRGVGLEQRQHIHLARKSLVEAVNADQIPDLYGSRVPCLQATMHGLPVATRPKIKMVQLQFTPFASDDTYHWQTTM
ncbi:pilus assembly protein [Escherichia coli]|nr:pilus assembly protein [Escherichia coli]